MTAQSIISRYNHMNGNAVSGATLREFHDSIQKYLDRSGSGPFTHSINGIRKRLAAVLNSVKTNDVVEVRVKLIDTDKQVAGYQVPVKVVKKKKSVSIPEQHRKKIEAQNKRMPKAIRDVMNGCDENLLHGLELNPVEAHESGLGFTQTGQQKIYDMVTEMILETMKQGGLFWREPWAGGGKEAKKVKVNVMGPLPVNFVSKAPYSGVNYWLLKYVAPHRKNYTVLNYLTLPQINQLGGKVKNGAKAWPVIYYSLMYKYNGKNITEDQYETLSEAEQKKAQKIPFIQYYHVFNAHDVEGVPGIMEQVQAVKTVLKYDVEPIKAAELIVNGMPKRPYIQQSKQRRAYYSPGGDFVHMPYIGVFDKEQEYYSTFFHELVHSTGHESRLDRELSVDKKKYSFEELIAELGASYLCAESGILYFTLNNSAAYLKGWSSRLREEMEADNKFFMKAAAKAQQASNFILDIDKKSKKKKKSKESFKPKSRGKNTKVVEVLKSKRESKKSRPPVERKERSQATAEHSKQTQLNGCVDASTLAGIAYSTFDIAPEWKKEFHKINSDSVLMIWGKPGSGKTVKLLKLAQHLSMDLKKKVLYIAEEEYGRSTLADKLTEHKIGNANLSFAPDLDAGIIRSFDAIFLDSVNSMHLSPADVKNLIRKHPGKLWVLIVQTTKEGDFRGGRDWEHLVDIAGEVVNRKMILRKNRLDPNNKAKADKLLVEEIVTEKKQAQEIKDLVKQKIEGEQKQQAA